MKRELMQTEGGVCEVRYEASSEFVSILEHLHASLLLTTYQAGKLFTVGVEGSRLKVDCMHYEQAMGLAISSDRIAVGTRRHVHYLERSRSIGPRIAPERAHDDCWAARSSFYTGAILGHDMAWGTEGLWVVNTLFSCFCTLRDGYNFVPRWRPSFVTELIDQDRCHLNGMALYCGQPKYATALGETNDPAGWRSNKAMGGCLIDVDSNDIIIRNLSMPHSPRMNGSDLWVLNSGHGALARVDVDAGRVEHVERLPGYTRGLVFAGQFAFVGISKIRETNIFGGLPIAEKGNELRCGVGVVDLKSGRTVATFQFHSGVEEIFAVDLITGATNPAFVGMLEDSDRESSETWIVPDPQMQSETAARQLQSSNEYRLPPNSTNIVRKKAAEAPA